MVKWKGGEFTYFLKWVIGKKIIEGIIGESEIVKKNLSSSNKFINKDWNFIKMQTKVNKETNVFTETWTNFIWKINS